MRYLGLLLCGLLTACAGPGSSQKEPGTVRECEIGGTGGSTQLEAPASEGIRVFNGRDVVQKLLLLEKPGDIAAWWASEPRAHPVQWFHPLSRWEREYAEAMASPTVPAPLRMRPPVEPGNLSAEEAREAEQLMGTGAVAVERYAHFENRRRIVAHYVLTHPATLRLQLGLYGLARDSNPLHFALERGWQVGRGKEMFTKQDASRLGAAAEFLSALAVGVAVEKALGLAHPPTGRGGSTPYLTPEVERAFVETVRLRAAHMVEMLSNNERGPVLTGVLDTRTGRTFFGTNHENPPANLHPLLTKSLTAYRAATGGVTPPRAGVPGAHSEIVALNKALYEREAMMGRPVEPQELSSFVLHNRSLRGTTRVEGIPPPCPNCEAILPSQIRLLP
ncbi:YwqJ-related putative deaminase [Archangium lipolyticum]|uniref:YwqJ-related putative deaminase n=1 Tax=Archangium lipolyticum TaxID=2970465 RepID=UPI002149B844|nr:YwqJ-related putative deaminase [Archangium lipolyticum]